MTGEKLTTFECAVRACTRVSYDGNIDKVSWIFDEGAFRGQHPHESEVAVNRVIKTIVKDTYKIGRDKTKFENAVAEAFTFLPSESGEIVNKVKVRLRFCGATEDDIDYAATMVRFGQEK